MGESLLKIDEKKGIVSFDLPLTNATGKVRVKERDSFYEYGKPVATRQTPLSLRHYVEWQIGYDLENNEENQNKTTLKSKKFINYKKIEKIPYELSEILYYSYKNNYITLDEIKDTYKKINETKSTLDVMESMQITRTNPLEEKIEGIDFYKMRVSYPLLVHKFGKYDIYAEIITKEKQRAVGVQPMLYVCLPITSLEFEESPIGRTLKSKEKGKWVIGEEEAMLSLELFRIFGLLTEKHKYDVCQILKALFEL